MGGMVVQHNPDFPRGRIIGIDITEKLDELFVPVLFPDNRYDVAVIEINAR